MMLSRGVDINGTPSGSTNGDRPLHCAILNSRNNLVEGLNGSVFMTELLVRHGARVNVTLDLIILHNRSKITEVITHFTGPFILTSRVWVSILTS